jgi:uncharacterized protein with GYD domain
LTTSHYDILTVSDVPDGIVTANVALSVGSAGNGPTETLRACTEDEYRQIGASPS